MNKRLDDDKPVPLAPTESTSILPPAVMPEPSLGSTPNQCLLPTREITRKIALQARHVASCRENDRLMENPCVFLWVGKAVGGCLAWQGCPSAAELMAKQMCRQGGQLCLSGGEGELPCQ